MKHKSLFLAILATLILSTQSHAYLYGGLQLGLNRMQSTNVKPDAWAGFDHDVASIRFSDLKVASDIVLGYMHPFTHFDLGLEGHAGWDNTRASVNHFRIGSPIAPTLEDIAFNLRRTISGGLALRASKNITDKFSVFGKLGVVYSFFKLNYNDEENHISNSDTKWAKGIAPGFGFEYAINDRIKGKIEYSYEKYQTYKTQNLATEYGVNHIIVKVRPQYHIVRVGFTVKLT